ncbi:MAG: hypothetical protein AAF743_17395 [Planctomycetota bacterium]
MLPTVLTVVAVAFVMLRLIASERHHARQEMYRRFVQNAPAMARQHREEIAKELMQR